MGAPSGQPWMKKIQPYRRPAFLPGSHLQTIFPALFRKVRLESPLSGEIELPDGDFLEFDHYSKGNADLVILCHGLEGNSRKPYMLGMTRTMTECGFDVVAWNYRCCGKKLNRLERLYHSGATDDLEAVVNHFSGRYNRVWLIGFSLGGNLVLKFLGEDPARSLLVHGAIAVSAPVDLLSASLKLARKSNAVYSGYFLNGMKNKIRKKAATMESMKRFNTEHISTVMEFDEQVTAPLHGFESAREYYRLNSAIRFMEAVRTPTLVISAVNDPFLSQECLPAEQFANHPFVDFIVSAEGGHVGFPASGSRSWTEQVASVFFSELLNKHV